MSGIIPQSIFTISSEAVLSTGANKVRFVAPVSGTITNIEASVNVAPVGSAAVLDVNKNGTTVFGTQANRPSVAATQTKATTGAHSVNTFVAGDVFTVDVDAVGSGTAGTGFTVTVAYTGKADA